ncbi:MAG: SMC-Scp complex subunit ScpB [Nanoarchaeota archaeon]
MEITKKEQDKEKGREAENLRKIEAALFISGKWLSLQELIMLTDINPILLKQLLDKLIERYKREEGAVEILSKENRWKMDVKSEHVNMINKLATGNAEFSRAEQETLAVIAYKQPIKQSVIIKIRGNKAYEHVKKFIQLGLVKGKRMGHTQELNLTADFHDYFHIRNQQVSECGPESEDSGRVRNPGETSEFSENSDSYQKSKISEVSDAKK